MPWWQLVLDAVAAVLVLVLLYGIALVVRRRVLSRRGGTFELSFRLRDTKAHRGWTLGIGRYAGGDLEWFRIFSLWPRPVRSWPRAQLSYVSHRQPEGAERMSLFGDHVVVTCAAPAGEIEIAMSQSSLTGFQSWLEAAPPGTKLVI